MHIYETLAAIVSYVSLQLL